MKLRFLSICTALLLTLVMPHTLAAYDRTVIYNSFDITVPYNGPTTIKDILSQGTYNAWEEINDKNFPQHPYGTRKVEVMLADFSYVHCDPTTNDVLSEFKKKGFRPATVAELLAFGMTRPVRNLNVVVALGQTWQDPDRPSIPLAVAIVSPDVHLLNDERPRVNLVVTDDWWDKSYIRFLAVRK